MWGPQDFMSYIQKMSSSQGSGSGAGSHGDPPIGARPNVNAWRASSFSNVPVVSQPDSCFGVEEAKKLEEAKASQAEADRIRMESAEKSRLQKNAKDTKAALASAKAAAKQPAAKVRQPAPRNPKKPEAAPELPPAGKRPAPAAKAKKRKDRDSDDESDSLDSLFTCSSHSAPPSPRRAATKKQSGVASSSKATASTVSNKPGDSHDGNRERRRAPQPAHLKIGGACKLLPCTAAHVTALPAAHQVMSRLSTPRKAARRRSNRTRRTKRTKMK